MDYNEAMIDELLQNNLYWGLVLVALRAKHSMNSLAEKHDLAIMQAVTLCTIESKAPMPMNSISEQLFCDASNVTGIVDRLVAHGLVARQENPQDRRLKLVALTDKGATLKEKILTELQTHEAGALVSLSSAQKSELQVIVSAVVRSCKPNNKQA